MEEGKEEEEEGEEEEEERRGLKEELSVDKCPVLTLYSFSLSFLPLWKGLFRRNLLTRLV